ncbi:MAG: CPBP family intramembrane metalloprotease [Oscillospiraceae bacterium]|nr:CPBP family intramembrane metalloprotease [Oscillospiraceae bacterium]
MKKNREEFAFPMRRYERVIGMLYIPVHAYLLPLALYIVLNLLGKAELDGARMELWYYAISSLFLLLALNRYWRATIRDFGGAPVRALQAVILGFVLYFAADWAVAYVMSLFMDNLTNPNSAAVIDTITRDPQTMMLVTVLLAPIAEETMFRGALFGTIRGKSRFAAYAVSALLFALYHLWGYMFTGEGLGVLVYLPQYIPAGIALAWCYERSGSLVAPVALHALVNFVATVGVAG